MPLLEVEDLHAAGGAVRGVGLSVAEGEAVAVVGRSGAGKSSLLGCIAGTVRPESGRIIFDGRPVHRLSPGAMVARGVALVPEGRHLFAGLSVEEHLRLGAWTVRRDRDRRRELREDILRLFPVLEPRLGHPAGALPPEEQHQVALARAMMAGPRLILLDEPSAGLARAATPDLFASLRRLTGEGVTVLVAEEGEAVLGFVDRGLMMEDGAIAPTRRETVR